MSKAKQIKHWERIANDERTSIPERLHIIYSKLYPLYGINIPGYVENGKAV